MEERRRHKRTQLSAELVLKRIDGEEEELVEIAVTDVSRSGVGFFCSEPLAIGTVYECYLTLWTKEVLHTFLRIVRIEMEENDFSYGAVFVGMSETDAARIEAYQTINEREE